MYGIPALPYGPTIQLPQVATPPSPPPPVAPEDPSTVAARLYANDPMYLMSVAQTKQERADAASLYLEQLKPLLLQYGDPALAKATLEKIVPTLSKYLGYTPDLTDYFKGFAGSTNPDGSFSTLARLAKQAREKNTNTTESYNKQNLFYGGHFGKAMRENEYQRQGALSDAQNGVFSQLSSLGQNYLASLNQAQRADITAAQTAYGNGLTESVNGASVAQASPQQKAAPPPPPPPPPAPFKATAQVGGMVGSAGAIKPPRTPAPQSKVRRPF